MLGFDNFLDWAIKFDSFAGFEICMVVSLKENCGFFFFPNLVFSGFDSSLWVLIGIDEY